MTYLPGDPFDRYDGALERGLEDLERWYQTLRDLCDYPTQQLIRQPGGQRCPKCRCPIVAGMRHSKCDPATCGLASASGPVDLGDSSSGRMADVEPDHPDEPMATG
jgi:hypothetical protein